MPITLDIRTQTSLLAAVLTVAITVSVILRTRRRRLHWMFGLFGLSIAAWYITTFAIGLSSNPLWQRVNLVCATAVPLTGMQFLRAFVEKENRLLTYLSHGATVAASIIVVAALTPLYAHVVVTTFLFSYVLVMLVVVLVGVYARSRLARSRFERARLRYMVIVGALAAIFTLFEYLPYVGLDIPPVGTVLILVFLYVLSQSILRDRLLDLYELVGRLGVLTAISFILAAIFWVLVELAGGRFFLHSVVAAIVVLLLFDPVRNKAEEKISQFFFRERFDLDQLVQELRGRVAHVLELDDLTRVLLTGLERSRRVTHAALYLVDEDLRGYSLASHFGPAPTARIEMAPARPFLDRLIRDGAVVLEPLERELADHRERGDDREAETLYEIRESMTAMNASVCLAVSGEAGDLYGILCVRDDRLKTDFSPEEVHLLRGLAAQAAIAVENSRLYQRLKERDRLAALGEMAAGLAHEIRNPLGAIKASAQFLAEPGHDSQPREFLDIIVEEVDRLNRVVSSFLDYARPSHGDPIPTDVNAAVTRTMQLLGTECQAAGIAWSLSLAGTPPPVRIDVEQLRQVLINLVHNAVQAMESLGGELVIETAQREKVDAGGTARPWVEIRVTDTGPGIPQRILSNLFVPFVTTKDRGTGLGLAISQRIVTAAGGHIEVRTHQGVGTTFVVHLPVADDARPGRSTMPPPLQRDPLLEGQLEERSGAAEPSEMADDSSNAESNAEGDRASSVATNR